MRRNISVILILICLFFNSLALIPTFAANTFKEGIYQLSNLNVVQKNRYTVQNISPDNSVYIALFDENQRQIQSIYLPPNPQTIACLLLTLVIELQLLGRVK